MQLAGWNLGLPVTPSEETLFVKHCDYLNKNDSHRLMSLNTGLQVVELFGKD